MKPILALLLCSLTSLATAQNLVPNSSFEEHPPLSTLLSYHAHIDFNYAMGPWQSFPGTVPHICDCQYTLDRYEQRSTICTQGTAAPHSGCTMMQMEYWPSGLDFMHRTRGITSYAAMKLEEPLEIGSVYEVAFWLHILPEDVDYARHIGFSLYPDVLYRPDGDMLHDSGFRLDTVIYNQWYEAKWRVRPLCNLQFLVIGAFRGEEGPPVHYDRDHNNIYYLDDVSVRKVAEAQDSTDVAITPFCRYKNQAQQDLPLALEEVDCTFATGSSELSPACRAALDSFALRAQASPKATFLVAGHTDSIGSGHEDLSAERAQAVLAYLEESGGVSPLRFVSCAYGADRPMGSNVTEEGRQRNRRVEVRQGSFELPNAIYRAALEQAFAGNKPGTAKILDKWLNLAPHKSKLLMLYDPRLSLLHGSPQWLLLEQKTRKSYGDNRLGFTLDSLWAEDQKHRTLKLYIENLAVYLHGLDDGDTRWDVDFPPLTAAEEARRDQAHYQALLGLVEADGWPRASAVGERPAKAAFLIAQHQPDTAVLARVLPMLHARCTEGEAEWIYYAAMYDRFQVLRGLPQRYGTQYRQDADGEQALCPLEDSTQVNRWREELGLVPLDVGD